MYFSQTFQFFCRLLSLFLITLLLIACQQEKVDSKVSAGVKQSLSISTVKQASTSYIRFAGKIEGNQSIDIASLQSGRLHKLHITEGMEVKQGEALAEVYSPDVADNYASAQAKLQQVRVTLTSEQLKFSRYQKLYDKKIISLQELETLYNNVKALEAQVNSALALVNTSKNMVKELVIYAKFDGIVTSLSVREGEYIEAGEQLLRLNQSDQLKAIFKLPEHIYRKISIGQQLNINIPYSDIQLTGVLSEVAMPNNGQLGIFSSTVIITTPDMAQIGSHCELLVPVDNKSMLKVVQTAVHYDEEKRPYLLTAEQQNMTPIKIVSIEGDFVKFEGNIESDIEVLLFNSKDNTRL